MSQEKIPLIYSAICGVMEDIGAIGKNDTNKQQGFKYRGIDSVMNALNPALIKHKIFTVPEVLEQSREERKTQKGSTLIYSVCRIRYRFYATDGSFVDAVVVGEGMDSGDKASNKALAVAFKYACFQTFCIPTEDLMDDPDSETPEKSDGRNHKPEEKQPMQNREIDHETKDLLEKLSKELARTGYGWGSVEKLYKVDSVEKLSKLQIKDCLKKMKGLPDKESS